MMNKRKEGKYCIEWDGNQWMCYNTMYPKLAVYGLGVSPNVALKSFINTLLDFEQNIKSFIKNSPEFKVDSKYGYPVYEFRPDCLKNIQLLRYNNGEWTEDDGEYDLAFVTIKGLDHSQGWAINNESTDGNIIWSWVKDGNWNADIKEHEDRNAWHYMRRSKLSRKYFDSRKHPNRIAYDSACDMMYKLHNICSGTDIIEFNVADEHILKGLVRTVKTKKTIQIPKMFDCYKCGMHDLTKEQPNLWEQK